MNSKLNYLLFVIIILSSCKPSGKNIAVEKESIEILVDMPLKSIINEQVKVYSATDTFPLIVLNEANEADILQTILTKKGTYAIISRMLTKAELQRANALNEVDVKQIILAYDGIAMIANQDFIYDSLTKEQLRTLFLSNTTKTPKMVFENNRSGSVNYLFEFAGLKPSETKNVFAEKSYDSLTAFLRLDKNSIGFIPYAYISEINSNTTLNSLEGLKILGITTKDSTGKVNTFQPSQENIATGDYPLVRTINLIKGNSKDESGMLFVNFLQRERAQRLFLKSGLVPFKMPGRQILIST
ncbi:MAG: substrate-binding domain-containing protein, partial [Bacteroidia bacterium]|nr:substrate-binding domain-containing protein [Bacteroidia bacterium]